MIGKLHFLNQVRNVQMDAPFPDTMVTDIEKFFRREHTRPDGLLLYNDVFEVNTFFPLQRKAEMRRMMSRAMAIKPKVVMEIGVDKGGSLYHWCKIPGIEVVIACEVRGCPYKELFEKNFPDIEFVWIEQSSYDPDSVFQVSSLLDLYSPKGRQKIDVLFIDGDKSSFLKDFQLYHPMVQEYGLIFMHDIRDDGPKQSFESIQQMGYHADLILFPDEYKQVEKPTKNEYENWLIYWRGHSCGVAVIHPKL